MRDFCDNVETASIHPSCNTDQGVIRISECASEKLIRVMKVSIRCQGVGRQHQPSPIFCEGYEQEDIRMDPKDGELCLCRMKPGETLVEVRSGTDVQIVRQT